MQKSTPQVREREGKVNRSTRAFVTDRDFATALAEDFPRLTESVILDALYGHPKKASIELCAWASKQDEPKKALKRWAEKHRPRRQKPEPTEAEVQASGDFFDAMMARKRARKPPRKGA